MTIKISWLLAFLFQLCVIGSAFGDRSLSESSVSVDVISGDRIEAQGAADIATLRDLVPGITVSNDTENQSTASIDLRGLGTTRTLVLVNGKRRRESSFGSVGSDVGQIPTNDIQRIEVLKGPQTSAIWGRNAVAGVVNMVTKSGSTDPRDSFVLNHALDQMAPYSFSLQSKATCDANEGTPMPFFAWVPDQAWGLAKFSDDGRTAFLGGESDGFEPGTIGDFEQALGPNFEYKLSFGDTFELNSNFSDRLSGAPKPYAPNDSTRPPAAGGEPASPTNNAPDPFDEYPYPPVSAFDLSICTEEQQREILGLISRRNALSSEWALYFDYTRGSGSSNDGVAPRDRASWQAALTARDQANDELRATWKDCVGVENAVVPFFSSRPMDFQAHVQQKVRGSDGTVTTEPAVGIAVNISPTWLGWNVPFTFGLEFREPEIGSSTGVQLEFTDDSGNAWFWDGEYAWPGPEFIDSGAEFSRKPKAPKPYFGNPPDPNASAWRVAYNFPVAGKPSLAGKFDYEKIDQVVQSFPGQGGPGKQFSDLSQDTLDAIPDFIRERAMWGYSLGSTFYARYKWAEYEEFNPAILNNNPFHGYWSEDTCGDTALAPEALGYVAAATSPIKSVADQWAFERVGVTKDAASTAEPTIVGIIDTGIDWDHLDFSWDNLWRNVDEIPGNGKDDDNNGYVDDVIGWDFMANNGRPWDHDGHGTFVAGIVAATAGNSAGIDGINSNAKIMVLKALNSFGRTRASYIAQAIIYGTDNGAKILNISVGPGFPRVVQEAVDYAVSKGVLIVTAAGNGAKNLDALQPGPLAKVITVAATDGDDKRAAFSNVGSSINVSAPGVDVVSLRARYTDFMFNSPETSYQKGDAFLGDDNRYYRSAGTSFAAPIVSAVASLVWSARPQLSHTEVKRILEQSARDLETPGRDRATGYGIVDAKAALNADPAFFIDASIPGVRRIDRDGLAMLQVIGVADADGFATARLEIGAGEAPDTWTPVAGELLQPVKLGELGKIPADQLAGEKTWTIRVIVSHQNGKQREGRYIVDLT